MGRVKQDARLSLREHRLKLKARKAPYWLTIGEGAHLGYYKGVKAGKWLARWREPGGDSGNYAQAALGEADDYQDATGDLILSFGQAQATALAWVRKVQTEGGRSYGPYRVNQAIDDYLAQSTMRDIGNTIKRLDAYIRPAIGSLDCAKLTTARLEKLQRDMADAPARLRTAPNGVDQNFREVDSDDPEAIRKRRASANRIMSMLKAALNLGFRNGRIANDSAWRRVKPFKAVDTPRLRFLSEDEARRLVNAAQGDFKALVMAGLLTGGRYQEIARLKVRDYEPASATLFIDRTKAGAGRPVYLDDEGVRLVENQIVGKASGDLIFTRGHRGWKASEQTRPLKEAYIQASIEPCSFHDIRRTYGARLALKGVPMAVIAKALGHADTRITERHYAHLQSSYVSDTIRAAVSGMGIVGDNPKGNVASLDRARR
jgi:integrase